MNKSDVKEFCIQLANEYAGWEYKAERFKNKTLKHSEIWIEPLWVLHLSAEPSVIVYNKSVDKVVKECFQGNLFYLKYWMARMLILRPEAHNHAMIYRKLVHTLPDAEAYIRDVFSPIPGMLSSSFLRCFISGSSSVRSFSAGS